MSDIPYVITITTKTLDVAKRLLAERIEALREISDCPVTPLRAYLIQKARVVALEEAIMCSPFISKQTVDLNQCVAMTNQQLIDIIQQKTITLHKQG